MTLDDLRRVLQPVTTRIANLLGRGVITGVDDARKVQELQISGLPGETRDEIEHFQPYGFTSNPPKGLAVLVAWFNGRRDHGVALGVGDGRYRIKNLASGEVAIYAQAGQTIIMKANGDIEMAPKAGQKVKISADVDVTGTLTASSDVITNGKSLKTHVHIGTALVPTVGGVAGTIAGSTGGPT